MRGGFWRIWIGAFLLVGIPTVAHAQTWRVQFPPSPSHATNRIASYSYQLTPSTGQPLAMQSLGKPDPVAGQITVDVTAYMNTLAPGTYTGIVYANGPGGPSAPSPVSDAFTVAIQAPDAPGKPSFIRQALALQCQSSGTSTPIRDTPFILCFDHVGPADAYEVSRNGTVIASLTEVGPVRFEGGLPAGAYRFEVAAIFGPLRATSDPLDVTVF